MLGNDTIGDCTVAGAMHCVMLWNKLKGANVRFSTLDAQDDYFAITGGSDDGADMVQVAKYWQATGFRDRQDSRHSIAAYLSGDPGNFDHIYSGCYLFGCVGFGIEITSSAIPQFDNGEPWAPALDDSIEGYHFVPLIDRMPDGNALVVTWGAAQEVTPKWLSLHLKEVVYYISEEEMTNGETPEGFNMAALEDDLALLGD